MLYRRLAVQCTLSKNSGADFSSVLVPSTCPPAPHSPFHVPAMCIKLHLLQTRTHLSFVCLVRCFHPADQSVQDFWTALPDAYEDGDFLCLPRGVYFMGCVPPVATDEPSRLYCRKSCGCTSPGFSGGVHKSCACIMHVVHGLPGGTACTDALIAIIQALVHYSPDTTRT